MLLGVEDIWNNQDTQLFRKASIFFILGIHQDNQHACQAPST